MDIQNQEATVINYDQNGNVTQLEEETVAQVVTHAQVAKYYVRTERGRILDVRHRNDNIFNQKDKDRGGDLNKFIRVHRLTFDNYIDFLSTRNEASLRSAENNRRNYTF
jgi:hypothetical protein